MVDDLVTLCFLVLLQAVLGFDNLLYLSLESRRAPKEDQARVRKLGILIAIGLRIGLLFLLVNLINEVKDVLFGVDTSFFSGQFNLHALISLAGGAFIMYTAIKEIWHMMNLRDHEHVSDSSPKSTKSVIMMIVLMNLVFSFDSILGAIALTDVFWVQAVAIVIGGLLMLLLADKVTDFLEKHRKYEVLGLFVLLVVGILLLTEGAHLAHMKIAGHEIEAMGKATFYFVICVLIVVDLVQSRYQRKLDREAARKPRDDAHAA